MIQVNPRDIVEKVYSLWLNGVKGLLISGGFDKNGKLPVEPFIDKLIDVKKKTNLFMSIHLGLVRDKEIIGQVAEFADLVDYELLWNEYMIRIVKNIDALREIFTEVFKLVRDSGLDIVPHIYAWHPWITIDELREEITYLNNEGVDRAILLVYIPPGEVNLNVDSQRILENIKYIRSRFHGELYMGCMRPWIVKKSIDKILVEESLVDRIVNPYYKSNESTSFELFDACCSIPGDKLDEFRLR